MKLLKFITALLSFALIAMGNVGYSMVSFGAITLAATYDFVNGTCDIGAAGTMAIVGGVLSLALAQFSGKTMAAAYNPILKQAYTAQLLEKYRLNSMFLDAVENDMTALVDSNDSINLHEMGADPKVFVNLTVFPMGIVELDQSGINIPLDTLSTENTRVGNVDRALVSYDVMEAHVRAHRGALSDYALVRAAHNYAPNSSVADKTYCFGTSGASVDIAGTNYKAITFKDIVKAWSFTNHVAKNNLVKKVLVLHTIHAEQLMAEDIDKFKEFTNLKEGQVMRFMGMDIYNFGANPKYHRSSFTKQAWGAADDNNTSPASSFGFFASNVMKALGSTKAYIEVDSNTYRGTLLGYEQRFTALPLRTLGGFAIVSTPA